MFCRKPSSRLILASLKWHALVEEVVTDTEAGDVDVAAVVVAEVGFDVVKVETTFGSFTTS